MKPLDTSFLVALKRRNLSVLLSWCGLATASRSFDAFAAPDASAPTIRAGMRLKVLQLPLKQTGQAPSLGGDATQRSASHHHPYGLVVLLKLCLLLLGTIPSGTVELRCAIDCFV